MPEPYNRWAKSRRLYGRIMRVGPKEQGCYRFPEGWPESLTDDELEFLIREHAPDNGYWLLVREMRQGVAVA